MSVLGLGMFLVNVSSSHANISSSLGNVSADVDDGGCPTPEYYPVMLPDLNKYSCAIFFQVNFTSAPNMTGFKMAVRRMLDNIVSF